MPMTLLQRLQKITEEVHSIPKTGFNKFANYAYVEANHVVEAVRQLLLKHGVYHYNQELSIKRDTHGKNFHCQIEVLAVFQNIQDPKDKLEVRYYTISADTLDKDIFKAKTNGIKYLYITMFKIPVDLPDTERHHAGEKFQIEEAQYQQTYSKDDGDLDL